MSLRSPTGVFLLKGEGGQYSASPFNEKNSGMASQKLQKMVSIMIKEIAKKISSLDIYEKRGITDDYCEFVFFTKDTALWEKALTGILGPAVKPPKAKPTKEDELLTKEHGGIYSNQTLFKKLFGGLTVIAMFWPWQDDIHTTLKVAVIKK